MATTQSKGKYGENIAVKFLMEKGYVILKRNWRYLKSEVDIIAKTPDRIVFVEVKTRSSDQFGDPSEFVTNRQQKMIINAAQEYTVKNNIELEARFDIIAIIEKDNNYRVEHIEEAFYPTL